MDATQLLRDRFGFSEFLPGQRRVIDALAGSGRALAVFPTGGGKSICYQLPALAFEGVTLVVSPLIALMKDQIDFLRRRGISAGRLDSSLSLDELRAATDGLLSGTLKLLYVAPERFQNERFLETLGRARIALFAIDEAHCISEWGHNFRPDYLKLADIAKKLGAPRILALTATATPSVVRDICQAFAIADDDAVVTGFYRHNLELVISPVSSHARDALLLQRVRARTPGPTIVYVTLQKTAERVAQLLRDEGLPASAYHAGMASEERSAVQDRWMASDRGIVVATIAFGMGIDKRDVRYVYHYNLPKSLESYSQEIGRAGRDGEPSVVEMLACPEDVPTLENFAYGDTPTKRSLRALCAEVLQAPGPSDDIVVGLSELADRHDMRMLVTRTALTYLELLGALRQGTPFYAGYRLRPKMPVDEIVARFRGEHAGFVEALFRHAKRARIWYSIDPERVATLMNEPRSRIVRAIEVLEERDCAEVSASELRHRFTRTQSDADVDGLTDELWRRFSRREAQEVARLGQVLSLITHDGCLSSALALHFGEQRAQACGHCSHCAAGRAAAMPPRAPQPPLPAGLDLAELSEVRATHGDALVEPRQVARLLCGLTSPALTRAKLSRHPLFGALGDRPFADVLAWCERVVEVGASAGA